MATKSAEGNTIAAADDMRQDGASAAQSSSTSEAVSTRVSGQDSGTSTPGKVKTEKELERERKKAEKLAKLEKKNAARAEAAATSANKTKGEKKVKEKKAEAEVLPPFVEETPPGEKKRIKSFDDPHYSSYHPVAVESAWYAWWEKEGFFQPQFTPEGQVKPEGKFVIVLPPPNVTGVLHMGHALGNSLQDMMIRYNRQKGKTTLWLPGCDHAGIATQNVVEKMLWKKKQQTRYDVGRTKFIELAQDWKEEYHKKITNAFRKMGSSLDWTREAFTMDENFSAAVTDVFVRFHEEGIIYRANRLVNWDSTLMTALSNVEVDNKELPGRTLLDVPGYERKVEFGIIVHFKYPIENSDETIEVATTRPETMLGDTGIAVHPEDPRYAHLVGKFAVHPFIEGRRLPIVADTYVDREFGTGAVKLTPAHDPNDFNLGTTHKLEFINILTDDGRINENGGPYQGQKRFDVRYSIQEDLKKLGLYVDKKDNPMSVPLSERTRDVVEPIMRPQWWVKMSALAGDAIKAVETGEIKIRPESAEKTYLHWMSNINDWCISRQLWWGHQCPVYRVRFEGEVDVHDTEDRWFAGRTEEEALAKAKKAWPDKKFELVRDEDVLDTWFSSGLWPFATLGWPNETPDLARLFPTSVLETGWDIIPFWVARMIFLSIKLTGKVPFSEVFCHSLIRDSEGRKMSKSLGNVVDPLDVISGIELQTLHDKLLTGNLAASEVKKATAYQKTAFPQGIPECGADALRFALIAYTTGGGDINFDVKVIHLYRRFCNKIWNACKYVLGKLETVDDFVPAERRALTGHESLSELWILHKMNYAVKAVTEAIEQRDFMRSANLIYAYWYFQLCDVFIENSKALIQQGSKDQINSALQTLYSALEGALVLSHPFLPFITEELWQRLPRRPGDKTKSIMLAKYPEWDQQFENPAAEAAYDIVLGSSKGVRSLMAEYAPKEKAKVFIHAHNATSHKTVSEEKSSIESLSGKFAAEIEILSPGHARPAGCVAFPVSSAVSVLIHVADRVNFDEEIAKATKKLEKARAAVQKQDKLINDPTYLKKANVVTQDADRAKLADLESEAKGLEATIEQFKQLKLE
ncbi:tRNA synthetases class I-domain-containing protein [Corynascus similis CBS 632.67]